MGSPPPKIVRSRRTLRIPQIAVEALQRQLRRQAEERSRARELWQEHGLVITTTVDSPYESHNLRRDFRKVTAAAGLGALGPEGIADLVRQHDELPEAGMFIRTLALLTCFTARLSLESARTRRPCSRGRGRSVAGSA